MAHSADVSRLFARMPCGRYEASDWASGYGDDLGLAWHECPRGDWILWLAGILEVDHRLVTLAASDCAAYSMSLLPLREHEQILVRLLEFVYSWADGEIPPEACVEAAKDVLDLYKEQPGDDIQDFAGSPTAGFSTAAVSAAVMLPIYLSPFGIACGAAAAALAAAQVAPPDQQGAMVSAHRRCAEIVRERIPFEEVVQSAGFEAYLEGLG